MGTWVTQAYLERMIGVGALAGMTDDSADPSTADADIIDQAIDAAESEAMAALSAAYPTDVSAGTASPFISSIVARIALGILGLRRLGPGALYEQDAEDARRQLADLAAGKLTVPEWSTDDGADLIGAMGYPDVMGTDDLVDILVDHADPSSAYDDMDYSGEAP